MPLTLKLKKVSLLYCGLNSLKILKMKKLLYILPLLFISLFISCTNDDDEIIPPTSEIEGLTKVQEFTNANHTVEVYTKSGHFYTGYNDISIRIKDNTDNSYYETYTINWMPMMAMQTMNHSCPKSAITKIADKNTLYSGNLVFQMTGMNGSGWSLKFMYNINGTDYVAEDTITVLQSPKQNVTTFTGSDSVKYILALIEPQNPKIGINNMKVGLYKMDSMTSFPSVPNYSIALDPRMPSMGNHTSPNNTDLTYNSIDDRYYGDLSLTMTGYWVLNLKLLNDSNTVLKGEDVTPTNTQSSLYLELEF